MIVTRNFEEMDSLHQSGKVPFRIMQEITAMLLGLCGYTKEIPEAIDVAQQEVDWLQQQKIDFMHYLGGNVFICETEDDLQQVTSMDMEFGKQHGRWPNVTEAVMAWDECKYLFNADGSADYALLFAATNNAGGPSWFIPSYLWQDARINEQIAAHQQFWGAAK